MLSLSIGSTLVDTQAASIPVVLRSPVFTEDGKIPGSFIFNFTLPLTDALKQELAHAHRPARKGKPTWQHPFTLNFGVLHYQGTANITGINATQVEVNMPVDTGDLALLLKDKTLKDLDVDEEIAFDPEFTFGVVPVTYNTEWGPAPAGPGGHGDDIAFELPSSLFDTFGGWDPETYIWTAPYTGTFKISVFLNSVFGTYKELGQEYPSGSYRAIRIKKNGTLIYEQLIDADSVSDTHTANYQFSEGDAIFIYLRVAASQMATGLYYYNIYVRESSCIIISDSQIQPPFPGIISQYWPDVNYAVFPFKNPDGLSNVPESLFRIDMNDIKDYHARFSNFLNYYRSGEFPWIISGSLNEYAYALFNVFTPAPYTAFLIQKLFDLIGFTVSNNVFSSNELKRLVLLTNQIINLYFYDSKPIMLLDFIPAMPLANFLRDLCKMFGLVFKVNTATRSITFAFLNDIIADTTSLDFSANVGAAYELTSENFTNFSISFTPAQCDYISNYVKSLEGLTIKGTVNLYLPESGDINDAWYVILRRSWYVWQYDAEFGFYQWVFHSADFPLEITGVDPGSDEDQFKVEIPLNTLCMGSNFNDENAGMYDNTIGAPSNRLWLVPMFWSPANFSQLPDSMKTEQASALLFYRGLYNDSNSESYPLATNDVYDYAGNKITGADLALRLDGQYGIHEKKWKKFIEWRLQSPGEYKFYKYLSLAEIANFDFFKWHKIFGVDYLLKEVRFNITQHNISIAEIVAHRR